MFAYIEMNDEKIWKEAAMNIYEIYFVNSIIDLISFLSFSLLRIDRIYLCPLMFVFYYFRVLSNLFTLSIFSFQIKIDRFDSIQFFVCVCVFLRLNFNIFIFLSLYLLLVFPNQVEKLIDWTSKIKKKVDL